MHKRYIVNTRTNGKTDINMLTVILNVLSLQQEEHFSLFLSLKNQIFVTFTSGCAGSFCYLDISCVGFFVSVLS